MRDELTKHSRKIYHVVKSRRHSFSEKVTEVIIEICIIVFAVTLSIWFHNWSEHRHEQREVREFLRGLKDDLNNDLKVFEDYKNTITTLDSNYRSLLAVKPDSATDKQKDTAISRYFKFDIPVTHPNIGRYEGFKSSGKIGTIENDKLKDQILVYYQQTIPNIAYSENYVNSMQMRIMDLAIDRTDKTSITDFVTARNMQILLSLGAYNFELNIEAYNKAVDQIKKIIAEIDKELR